MYFVYLFFSVVAVAITAVPYYDNDNGRSTDVYLYDIEEAEHHFNEFIEKFEKNYAESEQEHRFGVFKENLKKINDFNAEKNLNLHGITQFADMTDDEFMDYANCVSDIGLNMTNVNVIKLDSSPDVTYPSELDYRNNGLVTEVKNQGTCGSCYIFSAIGNIEGQHAKMHGQLISLSEQEGLDCAAPNGCDGDAPVNVMQSLAAFGGVVAEQEYPYYGQPKACTVNKNQILVRVQQGSMIQGGEYGLIQALNEYGPLSIGINVTPSLKTWFNNGHVFNDPTCITPTVEHHAALLIGYGTNSEGAFWLIKNSWGTTWGEGGVFKMARGVGMCGIGVNVATATVY